MHNGSLVIAMLLLALSGPSLAGDVERELESHWRGAWVLLEAETHSNCNGSYTDNRMNGRLSSSRGRYSFSTGELVKIDNLTVHRSRVDIRASIHAPIRVSRYDGPFTLFDHVSCRVELEIEVPRSEVRQRGFRRLEERLSRVMQRFETFESATSADNWNLRQAEPFPADYELTLTEYTIWKAERYNARIDARLAEAQQQLATLSRAVVDDIEYVTGFTAGVSAQRARRAERCDKLVNGSFAPARRKARVQAGAHETPDGSSKTTSDTWRRGYLEGQSLVYHLDLLARVAACYVVVPPHPDLEAARLEEGLDGGPPLAR